MSVPSVELRPRLGVKKPERRRSPTGKPKTGAARIGAALVSDRLELFLPPQRRRNQVLRLVDEILSRRAAGRTDLVGDDAQRDVLFGIRAEAHAGELLRTFEDAAAGDLVNPTGGVCQVDPDALIAENNEGNNSAADTLAVNLLRFDGRVHQHGCQGSHFYRGIPPIHIARRVGLSDPDGLGIRHCLLKALPVFHQG